MEAKYAVTLRLQGLAREVRGDISIQALLVHLNDWPLLEEDQALSYTDAGGKLIGFEKATGMRVFTDDKGAFNCKPGFPMALEETAQK